MYTYDTISLCILMMVIMMRCQHDGDELDWW